MFDAICQNKADQLFTLHVFVIFLIPALNGEKQTILYMLVILQHKCNGKTVLDVFVGNHLDLLAPPYLEKDYLRYPGGGLGRCTCIILCILQNM